MGHVRVALLGLDAVDLEIVQKWAGTGEMPNMAEVLRKSFWARSNSPPGFSWSTWTTLITSVSPARHGRYYYNQLVPGTYKTAILRPGDIQHRPFWEDLSNRGLKVAILDVPKTDPSQDINGIQISDWGNHDPDFHEAPRSWPTGEAKQFAARFGGDPVEMNDFGGIGPSDLGQFRDRLIANIERKRHLFEALIAERDWDLFVGVFDDAHQLSHLGWHIHDPSHPRHDPDLAAELGDPIKDVYLALDRAVGQILERLGPETVVIVFSSSGMGPNYHGYGLLEPILRRLEQSPSWRDTVHKAMKYGWDRLQLATQKKLNLLRIHARDKVMQSDWSSRRFFSLPFSDDGGAIRINLAHRDPQGRVKPGAEYEACCAQLIEDLLAIVNPDTNRPLIEKIYTTNENFSGAHLATLPDLTIRWNTEAPNFAAYSPRIGTVRQTYSPSRTGTHMELGFIAAYGPKLPEGELNHIVPVTDVAPTIASLLGAPLSGVDGRPIPEIVH